MNKGKEKQKESVQEPVEPQDEKETKKGSILELENEIISLTNTLKRLQADFENYQKRTERQNNEFRQFASASIIEQLLPVLDSLEQGMKHSKELVLIHDQLNSILKKNGLEKIVATKGCNFDHDKMECLMQEECKEVEEDKVANVLLTGYTLNGKILRLAKVSIRKSNSKESETGNEDKDENENKSKNEKENFK